MQDAGKAGADARPRNDRLVCFVVNKGYAEDAMAAARKAGASGGTVLPARGTAKPGDATFLGVPLVPEKEMLLVLVPAAAAGAVCAAVRALPCFSAPGSGVSFRVPVTDFVPLGGAAGASGVATPGNFR
ncbi:MAG: P-II family nitrogen regulator [Kiritimatiellae bacterium]|nr:P-II family nitrogen regulator [Kiritimatiellia bacterium]